MPLANRLSKSDRTEIRRMSDAGIPKKEIARIFKVCPKTVRYHSEAWAKVRQLESSKRLREGEASRVSEQERSKRRMGVRKADRAIAHRLKRTQQGRWMPKGGNEFLWGEAERMWGNSCVERRAGLDPMWIYEKLVTGVCEATGLEFDWDNPLLTPSPDRTIPASKGGEYTKENTKIVCLGYNLMKMGFSEDHATAFIELLRGA